jgi:hypothetical protein
MLKQQSVRKASNFGKSFHCRAKKAAGIFLAMTLAMSYTAFAQEDTASASGTAGSRDSTVVLFEDLYGRFPSGVMPSIGLSQNSLTYDNSPGFSSDYRFTNGNVNVGIGDRATYQVVGGVQDMQTNNSYKGQAYNFQINLRPAEGWQLTGLTGYDHYGSQPQGDNYSAGLSVTHLSGGTSTFTQSRMQQYFYFSNLLPDRGQLVFSFSPTYGWSREAGGFGNMDNVETPFSLSYGLPGDITFVANADYLRVSNSSPYYTGSGYTTLEYRNMELKGGIGLNRLFTVNTLVALNADFYSLGNLNSGAYNTAGPLPVSINSSEIFGVVSLSVNSLFLGVPLTVYDLRRSYYTGRYLHEGEAMNQLTARFATRDITLPEQLIQPLGQYANGLFGVDERFSYGLLGFLQASLDGELTSGSKRSGSVWLSFHRLEFQGNELGDFDYFFGMITRPGDYSVTVGGTSSNNDISPSLALSAIGRFGIIKDLDISLNYSYQKYSGSFDRSGNNWGFDVRGNLIGFMRLDGSVNWGTTDYASLQYIPSRMKSLNFNLSVKTFF